MAYWTFDFSLINLGDLPAGVDVVTVNVWFSEFAESAFRVILPPLPTSKTFTIDTRDPEPDSGNPPPPFEVSASSKFWIVIELILDGYGDALPAGFYSLGPYTVGVEGTEVPPP